MRLPGRVRRGYRPKRPPLSAPTFAGMGFCGAFGPLASSTNQQSSTSRIGTYGQYSLGLAAAIIDTGWLGFVRVDYRNGNNLEGWIGNAGLRYQFTPETIA